MASLFTRIVNGEIPAWKVAEDENFFAFLDIFPVAKGHTLVIPKKEVDYLFDLDDETYAGLQLFAKKVALGLQKAIPPKISRIVHLLHDTALFQLHILH